MKNNILVPACRLGVPVLKGALFAGAVGAWLLGCTTTSPKEAEAGGDGGGATAQSCDTHDECDGDAPLCLESICAPKPAGHRLGWGDGSVASVEMTLIYTPDLPREATDLAFHGTRNGELWVLHREYESTESCDEGTATQAGCFALEGSTAIVTGVLDDNPQSQLLRDANAWHFMRRPTALAMDSSLGFATCGEARTGNYLDSISDFMGPTLWSSDLSVHAQPSGGNGSHMDMLHGTPFCMGIAHESDNIYWAFNGQKGAIDRVDFKLDHGPGNDDHSDGEYHRYIEGQLLRTPNVPSHMVFDEGWLYIADTGNGRIVRLDTNSGSVAGALVPVNEPLQVSALMADAVLEVVVAPGTLSAPSGLILRDGELIVSDNGSGKFHAFGLDGTLLRSLDSGLAAGSLAGIALGPDDKIYFVDKPTGRVLRIDPK